jgi:hypothetical protein
MRADIAWEELRLVFLRLHTRCTCLSESLWRRNLGSDGRDGRDGRDRRDRRDGWAGKIGFYRTRTPQ